jgi:hypothetical protein
VQEVRVEANWFQVQKLRRSSIEHARGAPESLFESHRRVESLGRLSKFENLRRDSAKGAQDSDLFQVPKLRRSGEKLHAERKCAPGPRLNFIAKAQER